MKTTIDPSIIDEIFNKTKAELEKLIPVNIMIIGKTGMQKYPYKQRF